jgi:hypothetical protein
MTLVAVTSFDSKAECLAHLGVDPSLADRFENFHLCVLLITKLRVPIRWSEVSGDPAGTFRRISVPQTFGSGNDLCLHFMEDGKVHQYEEGILYVPRDVVRSFT